MTSSGIASSRLSASGDLSYLDEIPASPAPLRRRSSEDLAGHPPLTKASSHGMTTPSSNPHNFRREAPASALKYSLGGWCRSTL